MYTCYYGRHTVTALLAKDFASFNHNAHKRLFQFNFFAADPYRFPMQCSYNAVDPFCYEKTRDAEDEQPSRNYGIQSASLSQR